MYNVISNVLVTSAFYIQKTAIASYNINNNNCNNNNNNNSHNCLIEDQKGAN